MQMNLKVPAILRDKLKTAAEINRRSMTAELVERLMTSLENDDVDGRFEDLEHRISHIEDILSGHGLSLPDY